MVVVTSVLIIVFLSWISSNYYILEIVRANICIGNQNLEAAFLYFLLNTMFAKNLVLAVRVYDMNIPTLAFEFIFHYVLLQLPCII